VYLNERKDRGDLKVNYDSITPEERISIVAQAVSKNAGKYSKAAGEKETGKR